MGSSMVTMWQRFSWLMMSIMAASVVLLPEPVGPVTRNRPRVLKHSGRISPAGSPRLSSAGISNGMNRNAPATAPRW